MSPTALPVGLCAAAALALAACSSGQSAASRSTPTTAASTASATPSQPVVRPTVSVSIGPLHVTFATPLPTDPAKAQVIEGFQAGQIRWDEATYSWRLGPQVAGHVTSAALSHLMMAVSYDKDHHVVPAGPDRYYQTTVSTLSRSRATVTTCEGGNVGLASRSTGRIEPGSGGPFHFLERWTMVKLADGWAMASFTLVAAPDPRAARCLR